MVVDENKISHAPRVNKCELQQLQLEGEKPASVAAWPGSGDLNGFRFSTVFPINVLGIQNGKIARKNEEFKGFR